MVVKQLMQHINSNNLDDPRQSAYKSGHSTETALLHIKNKIHLSLSRGKSTTLGFLNLLAAFDTTDHITLLNCLKSWFGVCSIALEWFTSYLPVRIFGNFTHLAVVLKNLGAWFDANFSSANHVRNICKTCFIQIRDLRQIGQYFIDEAAILAANALVSNRLDYCNSLFRSLSSLNMHKLQCFQNTLASIVTNYKKYTLASPILKQLL